MADVMLLQVARVGDGAQLELLPEQPDDAAGGSDSPSSDLDDLDNVDDGADVVDCGEDVVADTNSGKKTPVVEEATLEATLAAVSANWHSMMKWQRRKLFNVASTIDKRKNRSYKRPGTKPIPCSADL